MVVRAFGARHGPTAVLVDAWRTPGSLPLAECPEKRDDQKHILLIALFIVRTLVVALMQAFWYAMALAD